MIDLGPLSHIKQRYACQFCRMITETFDGRAQDGMIIKDANIHMKIATDRKTAFFFSHQGTDRMSYVVELCACAGTAK